MKMRRGGTGEKKNRSKVKRRRERKSMYCMCVWESEIRGEKKRGKMKGTKTLGRSCESKCGREWKEKKMKEQKRKEKYMTGTDRSTVHILSKWAEAVFLCRCSLKVYIRSIITSCSGRKDFRRHKLTQWGSVKTKLRQYSVKLILVFVMAVLLLVQHRSLQNHSLKAAFNIMSAQWLE